MPEAPERDWARVNQTALEVARRVGDRAAQAHVHNDLGIVHQRQGRYEEALDCQRRGLAIRRELGDAHCEAESLRELGVTLRALGRPQEARTHWLEALAFLEQIRVRR